MGQNPKSGVIIDYFLATDLPDSLILTLDIMGSDGDLIRSYSSKRSPGFKKYTGGPSSPPLLSGDKGVNRFSWDMRRSAINGVPDIFLLGGYSGAMVPPGSYTLRLSAGDDYVSTTTVQLLADPRIDASQSQYDEQYQLMLETEELAKLIQQDAAAMHITKRELKSLKEILKRTDQGDHLVSMADTLLIEISEWEGDLIQPDQKTFQDVINFPNRLNAEASSLLGRIGGMIPTVTTGMRQRLGDLKQEHKMSNIKKNRILEVGLVEFNQALRDAKVDLIKFLQE